jgi:hypothetical protein
VTPVLRQGLKERIDRPMQRACLLARLQPQNALLDTEPRAARNDMNMVGLDRLMKLATIVGRHRLEW